MCQLREFLLLAASLERYGLLTSHHRIVPFLHKQVINDLDLEVSLKGRTHFPNGKNGKDKKNSAERVIINGVVNGEVATITVTGENLSRMQQKYSVVVTGCFGGVANQLYANGECSAFDCDDSQSRRTKKILMAIFIPIGFALVCVAASSLLRKRRRKIRAARRTRVRAERVETSSR